MPPRSRTFLPVLLVLLLAGVPAARAAPPPGVDDPPGGSTVHSPRPSDPVPEPSYWGEAAPGVVSSFNPARGGIALTFDLCGGPKGSGFDAELLGFLRREGVRATIFVSGRWIEANPGLLETFAGDPLFEIANHGFRHRPCSATGREAYGIAGTASVAEMTDEIGESARLIARVTGRRPRHYRSGTAYTDEVCPRVAADLGQRVVNYTVLGDAGGTFRAEQVRDALLGAAPGSIVLLHLNRPQGQTAEGVREALPILKGRGVPFRTLEEALRGETSPPGTP